MKKKILDVTLKEFKDTCAKHTGCFGCPFDLYCGACDQEEVWEEEIDLDD